MTLKNEIDILAFNRDLHQTYERYIYTANLISDQEPSLQSAFYERLSEGFSVLCGPYVHCTPCYKQSYTLQELIAGKGEIKLSDQLAKLPPDQFAPDRPLYTHQVEALRILSKEENLIVATGTGSGKTECFLLPILNDILDNPQQGLRAIMIYPMNALADDQLGRLRRLLSTIPEVTFGRYTGDTPETVEGQRLSEIGQNERYTRREIRTNPPHILLTNFAMLEYLLLRPRDSDIFKGNRLRFIVLDEAHSYSGAQGIEIALLMRRLREYLQQEEGTVQFVLTRATLGDDAGESRNVTRFGFDISGVPFESKNVLQGETIDDFSNDLQPFPSKEALLGIGTSGESIELWTTVLEDAEGLVKRLAEFKIDCGGVSGRSASRLLFDLFCISEPLNRLHQQCRQTPTTLEDICELLQLPLDNVGQRAVQWLITMGSYARRTPDASPLLPTRVHFFARGLAGATVCLADGCPGKQSHPSTGWSSFFLEDRNLCQHCESKVLPLLTCVHCGLPTCRVFLVDGKWQLSSPPNDIPDARLLTWSTSYDEYSSDEDEPTGRKAWVCLQCGIYSEDNDKPKSCGAHNVARLSVLDGDKEGNGNLSVCPRCGGQHGAYASVLRDFRTRDDAPTAVLAETLIRNLPFDEKDEERAELPAHGRNLLVFSDARQRAAFFAPYLEQTTLETAYLGPLVSAITEEEQRESRPVSFEEITGAYVRGMEKRRMSVIKKRDKNGIDYFDLIPKKRLRSSDKSVAQHAVELLLYQNFCSSYRNKTSLPGAGIAALSFDFNEEEREKLPELIPEIFCGETSAGWDGLYALLNVFFLRKAIALPHDISTRDILNPGPKAVTYHLALSGNHDGRQVVRWNPYLATKGVRVAISKSRQLDIVARLTKMDKEKNAKELSAILLRIWDAFKDSMLLEAESWPGEFRLDPSLVQVTRLGPWGLCGRCGRLTTLINLGFCLTPGCQGKVKNLGADEFEKLFKRNHYRQRYFLPPLEIRVKEHTAQLTNECGKEYQRKFMNGEINVLSSSTTFEMGVDVGALKAVLLRNVPPTTSSYIQRAGRAGRRKDGVSVALTFCRNVPHDQYHYQKPEAIILGRVPSPYLNLRNKPLTQRHCNSLLLGYYLRSVVDVDPKELDRLTIDTFFLKPDEKTSLAASYETWLGEAQNRRLMISSVKGILPEQSELIPGEVLSSSVDTLLHNPKGVLNYHVRQPLQQLANQFAEIEKQLKTASGPIRIALARSSASLDRLIRQFKEERLIDFLSSCSWLPGYAFPQDIVKLLVRQDEYGQRMRLQRDREIGISEYAPGAEIVADGWLFTSGGVWFNSREPEIRKYARCPECRKIDRYLETERPSKECSRCGTKLSGKFLPRPYIRPDGFTTLVTDTVRRPGMFRRPGARTTEIFLLEGAARKDFRDHRVKGVSFAEKSGGRLFLANSGFQYRGYQVCRKCGRGFTEEPSDKTHETPWGTKCTGSVWRLDLAHEITTDILQLRFQDCTPTPPYITERPFWMSFVAAFLNGASDALNIKGSDLGGTYHGWTEESYVGELVVYDRIPGGAGHISRIVTNLGDVLKAALARVRDCKCPDLEASCYACLRSYNNQFYWDQLKRKPVIDWLSRILKE